MFGNQNDQQKEDDNQIPDSSIDGAASEVSPDAAAPVGLTQTVGGTGSNPYQPWQHPASDSDDDTTAAADSEIVAPAEPAEAAAADDTSAIEAIAPPAIPAISVAEPIAATTLVDTATTDNIPESLIEIKQQALKQLSPLVGHLDQTPEERFRTAMMMIQASDDQTLVQMAYDAAQKIEDEKTKAQALLDIVNEINYFTQHQQGQA